MPICNWDIRYWVRTRSTPCTADQLTERQCVEAKNRILFWKLADGEGGRLILQKNHLIWVWMPHSFLEQRWWGGCWGSKVKRAISLTKHLLEWPPCGRDVFISFLQPFTSRQHQIISLWAEQRHLSLTVRHRGRVLWGRPLYMIIITKATQIKSKKQFQKESELALPCNKPSLLFHIFTQ